MDFYYNELGVQNKETVVLLHGGGVGGWMWSKQLDALADYHLIIPDIQGHGHNADLPFETMNESALQLITLIQEKKHSEQVTLIGFSLGAQLSLEILSQAPELVATAVVVSALVCPIKGKSFAMSMLKSSFPLLKNKSFSKLQAKQLLIPEEQFEQYYDDSLKLTKENFLSMMESNLTYTLPHNFHTLQVRSLLLVGEHEKKIMLDSARTIVSSNALVEGYVVHSAGHDIPLSSPELFNQLILHWIKKEPLPNTQLSAI